MRSGHMGSAAIQTEEAKPRPGWERKAIDMFKPLRDAGEDMRMAARQKAYKHVLSVVVPSILLDITDLVVRMYPHETAYERWMLLTAAENLADIVSDKEKKKKEEVGNVEKIKNVLQAATAAPEEKEPMGEAGLFPKRGWTGRVKDFLSALRQTTVDLRRDAQGGDFRHLLAKVFPGMLTQMSVVLDTMFPDKTDRQRKMLLKVADELVDLSSGVMVTDAVDPEDEESVDTDGKE